MVELDTPPLADNASLNAGLAAQYLTALGVSHEKVGFSENNVVIVTQEPEHVFQALRGTGIPIGSLKKDEDAVTIVNGGDGDMTTLLLGVMEAAKKQLQSPPEEVPELRSYWRNLTAGSAHGQTPGIPL